MGFDKKYISEKDIKSIANSDYKKFFKFFKSGGLFDKFSTDIIVELEDCKIDDKDKIIKIMIKYK